MIKAVIFDMDGLMFDTEQMFKQQFREKLNAYGLNAVPDTVIQSMIGCDSRRIAMYENQYPTISKAMEECQQERMDYFFRFFPVPGSANKQGLKELVQYLKNKNIPFAIASSSYREHIETFLEYAGFPIEPALIVSGKEGYASKPDPAIFLGAANKLGVDPSSCLVLEDSKNGILAAKNANMISIFIPDQIVPDQEMKEAIQYEKKDLSEVIDFLEQENEHA
ncbi:HAD family hydrolase [Dubosiella newyorkensis]|uniref:HAD family hydrolase n=1 Tax=Dubosiella newyorkensis TaxID=1862672 RepID=UPI0023F14D6B|nr:HAD family phosphatase [Dubosiella newyorkensis]